MLRFMVLLNGVGFAMSMIKMMSLIIYNACYMTVDVHTTFNEDRSKTC